MTMGIASEVLHNITICQQFCMTSVVVVSVCVCADNHEMHKLMVSKGS